MAAILFPKQEHNYSQGNLVKIHAWVEAVEHQQSLRPQPLWAGVKNQNT